jgi:hypothetical protein
VTWECAETGVELKTLDLRDDETMLGGSDIRLEAKL